MPSDASQYIAIVGRSTAGMKRRGHKWSKEEDDYLHRHYGRILNDEIGKTLGRSAIAVQARAAGHLALRWNLGINQHLHFQRRRPGIKDAVLSCLENDVSKAETARRLQVSLNYIERIAKDFSIEKPRRGCLSDLEQRFIIANWGRIAVRDMAKLMKRWDVTIRAFAREAQLPMLKPGQKLSTMRRRGIYAQANQNHVEQI